jgi:GT2 family glycosyltransferase
MNRANLNQHNFAIGIPTLNRYDLLKPSLEKYVKDFPSTQIFILDNGSQGIAQDFHADQVTVISSTENLGVAKSWNLLCRQIFSCSDYALILNDDIYLGKTEEQIAGLLMDCDDQHFIVGNNHWCAFLLPAATYFEIGAFDENFFPAYFEDNCYAYRLKLAGKLCFKTSFLDPEIYRNSQTIQKDMSINNRFLLNREYYMKKWGGLPGEETFIIPFNGGQ